MSVRINPCFGCPLRVGCDQRAVFAKRVHGIGLRSATFNCDRLSAAITPGTRIVLNVPIMGEESISRHLLPATITSSKGNEFACVIDEAAIRDAYEDYAMDEAVPYTKARFRKTMRHSRIVKFLDEPKREMCSHGNPILPGYACDAREQPCGCERHDHARGLFVEARTS